MSASVPAISCRCMHALTYSIYLDCHTSPQSSYLVCCTYLVSACMSSLLHLFQCTFLPSYSPPYVYSLCVVYSLHCLISLPVSCWSLPIACLLYMPIQFATPKYSLLSLLFMLLQTPIHRQQVSVTLDRYSLIEHTA